LLSRLEFFKLDKFTNRHRRRNQQCPSKQDVRHTTHKADVNNLTVYVPSPNSNLLKRFEWK